jgi:hypothetical protein
MVVGRCKTFLPRLWRTRCTRARCHAKNTHAQLCIAVMTSSHVVSSSSSGPALVGEGGLRRLAIALVRTCQRADANAPAQLPSRMLCNFSVANDLCGPVQRRARCRCNGRLDARLCLQWCGDTSPLRWSKMSVSLSLCFRGLAAMDPEA